MKKARCRVCGAAVRPARLERHMRFAHPGASPEMGRASRCAERRKGARLALSEGRSGRSRLLRFRPLILATVGVLMVGLVAMLLARVYGPKPGEGEEEVENADPNTVNVQFRTDDGFELKGTYYRTGSSAPLVILVHGLNEDRKAYNSFIPQLRSSGFNVLAFDSRGHGQSLYQNGRRRPWTDESGLGFTEDDFRAMPLDIAAAEQYALASFESAPLVAIVGASIGANEALHFAASREIPELRALVLLSPGRDYRGLESGPPAQNLSERGTVAIFFAASQGDSSSSICALELHAGFKGRREIDIQPGSAHGTGLLSNAELCNKLLAFLKENL
ncbi:MAG: alpha/beta fold hydrolase [Thermoplasmata archaeon]